jgi:hypothetical protein
MNKLIQLLQEKPAYKHVLFFFLTLFILLTYGYYFGTFDQASHIPFLKKTIDTSLFPRDHFFDLRSSHYSYFWLFFIPFYKSKLLEVAMFVVYILTTYLTFWALWNISKTLFSNTLTSLLVVVSAAFPHIGFCGFSLFEFSMLNRTVVLPFEIIALNLYLKKKYWISFFILGVLYNFHALSVHFILAMIGVDIIVKLFKKRDVRPIIALPLFFISALPVFVWKFGHSGVQFTAAKEWFHLLEASTFFHLFHFVSLTYPVVNLLTAGGVSAIILFFIAKKSLPKNEMHETILHFVWGGIIVLFIQLIASNIYPSTIIIEAQIMRIGIFISLFSYIYVSHMIGRGYKSKYHFICFATALILSFSPLFLLISLLFWNIKRVQVLKIVTVVTVGIFITTLFILLSLHIAQPGIHIYPQKTAFYDAQMWAKTHTSKNTRFLTPPAKWWLYDIEWRVISERSTVCALSELLEAAFDPTYIRYWKPRFEDVAPGALAQFKGNYLNNIDIANKAFYANSTNRFIYLAKKYNVSYLVVEKKYAYKLPLVYQNSEYAIYSLPR